MKQLKTLRGDLADELTFPSWPNAGTMRNGQYTTCKMPEYVDAPIDSHLSDLLESEAPEKAFISPEHCVKWIERERVVMKGREIALPLLKAFQHQASVIPGTVERLPIRRMLAVEYERLQGLPDGWTQLTYAGKSSVELSAGCPAKQGEKT